MAAAIAVKPHAQTSWWRHAARRLVWLVVAVAACLVPVVGTPAAEASSKTPTRCRDLFVREIAPISIESMFSGFAMAVADFNGDRRDDIAYDVMFTPDGNR